MGNPNQGSLSPGGVKQKLRLKKVNRVPRHIDREVQTEDMTVISRIFHTVDTFYLIIPII